MELEVNFYFFADVSIYLYVNTLKTHQQFSTYNLIIDGNGIKRSVLLKKNKNYGLVELNGKTSVDFKQSIWGERFGVFFFFLKYLVLCSVFKPALMRTPEGYVPPFPK